MEGTLNKIMKKADKKGLDAVAYVHRGEVLSIEYEKDVLSNTSDGYTDMIEIRVSKGKK